MSDRIHFIDSDKKIDSSIKLFQMKKNNNTNMNFYGKFHINPV